MTLLQFISQHIIFFFLFGVLAFFFLVFVTEQVFEIIKRKQQRR